MIKVEMEEGAKTIAGTSRRTGEAYSFRVQKGYLHTPGAKYPTAFDYMVPDDATPLPAGAYILAPDSIYVDKRGRLAISPRFRSLKDSTKAA